MRMWSQFAARQKERYVPIPPDANRRVLPETKGRFEAAALGGRNEGRKEGKRGGRKDSPLNHAR
jgi:hypothetical protein